MVDGLNFTGAPSMKVPPKRKGNASLPRSRVRGLRSLNESPSEKEGKYRIYQRPQGRRPPLNESPSEKEGKFAEAMFRLGAVGALNESPSEKEGKSCEGLPGGRTTGPLNESPSEKEGKCRLVQQ